MASLNQHSLALLSSVTNVNMNTSTPTILYTVPADKLCVVTHVVVRHASISLDTASYSFGFTSPTYTDVVSNSTHPELTDSTVFTVLGSKTGALIGTPGSTFNVLMNILQGVKASTTIEVFGYLFAEAPHPDINLPTDDRLNISENVTVAVS